ncbi:MAG: TIGR03790 family protein [Myxococcota bacterium]
MRPTAIGLLLMAIGSPALAVPGPDSVAVLANSRDRASVELAERYIAARQIPHRQLCLLDLPLGDDVDLATYRASIEAPFFRCLDQAGITARIEAAVVMRGMPLRVLIPMSGGAASVSMTAALGLYHSTTSTGAPILGQPPGVVANCGSPCLAATWPNPFRTGTFSPGYSRSVNGVSYRPLLVTMIHGRSAEEAAKLIASATTADALGGARGTFMFMDGADPARGALDTDYVPAARGLNAAGFTDVVEVPFDGNATGHTLAAFFTGTAGIGQTIEGNRFLPGALVDNLTSYGAVPQNFGAPADEVQVSIARWVAMGVAGVHGTVDEPLNNCFPSRQLIVDYAEGGTLGEAYLRAMPFVYWRNLVLGDPMTAPYKTKTSILVDGLNEGDTVVGSRALHIETEDPLGRRVGDLWLYVDGVEAGHSRSGSLDLCLPVPVQDNLQILVVSQIADVHAAEYKHRPKSWLSLNVRGTAGPSDCNAPDAGTPDLGVEPLDAEIPEVGAIDGGVSERDASTAPDVASPAPDGGEVLSPGGGCSCGTSEVTTSWGSFMIVWIALLRRRGRR